MTGEQQNPENDTPSDFGEIRINPNAGQNNTQEQEAPSPPPEPRKRRKQRKKSKDKQGASKKNFLLCGLFLLLLPGGLLLCYLAAARYLLPYYIRERLAEQYSRQLHRPVAITQVDFAPFTFDLQLAGIHIGPEFDRQDQNEPGLCHIATLATQLRFNELLQRRIVLEDVRIKGMQTEMVRRADGSFTDLAWAKPGGIGGQRQPLLPQWLRVDGFSLTESMLVVRDMAAHHEYHLDEINFSLPSAASQQKETVPTLHALVNGNPIQIRGQRRTMPDGSTATHLVLQLDNVDPQQILAWLPGASESLHITSEQTTASLELIWPDNPQNEQGMILAGTVSFAGMDLKAMTSSDGTLGKIQCTAPRADLVIRANPFRKQYRVEQLTLEAPQFLVSSPGENNDPPLFPLSQWTSQLLKPAELPFDLTIKRLTIHKGSIRKGQDPAWEDLLIELTDYRNHPLAEEEGNEQEQQAPTLSFSGQQRKSSVQFQGTTTPDLQLSGELSFDNLDSSLLQPYLGTKQGIQLSGGKTHLVMQVNPQQQEYTIKELTLDQPQLLAGNLPDTPSLPRLPLSLWPGRLLTPASLPFDLLIQHLTINKGTILKGKKAIWEELQLELSGYQYHRTANGTKEQTGTGTALSFSCHQGVTTVRFQGDAAPDLRLNGKLSLHNLDSNLFQAYLGADQAIRFSGGKADMNGLLRTQQIDKGRKEIRIEQGTLTIPAPRLAQGNQAKDKALLSADMLEAQGCIINLSSPTLSCADLVLQQAEFSPLALRSFLFPDKTGAPLVPALKSIKLLNAKAWLPLDGSDSNKDGLAIPLSNLNLELTDLQGTEQNKENLHLQAAIGPDGRLKADGSYRQGQGSLQLTGEDLNITFLDPAFRLLFRKELAPVLQQGRLSFQGLFQVPEFAFQGDVVLRDLRAENRQGTGLSWKNGQAKQVLVGMKPFFMHMDELALEEPVLKLPSAQSKVPDALTALLRIQDKKPVLPPFTMKQCSIQGGSMPGAGSRLGFSGVNGSLAHLAAGTPASFTFSGKVNKRKFSAQGRLGQDRTELDTFTVAELPMESATKHFAEQLGLEKKGTIRWVPSTEQKDQGQVQFSDFLPQQDSEYALLLALLTSSEGKVTLPLSLPATASPTEISQTALKTLQHLRLQAVVSPQAVLERELPDLTLPRRIDFIVGDILPDFMTALESFAPLLERRPYLGLQVQGCYDDTADRKYLLRLLQEEDDYRIDLENDRRKEEMARLIAEEELRQVELVNTDMPIGEDRIPLIEARADLHPLPHQPVKLPKEILPELARQRARVVQEYLINTIKLPAERITIVEPTPGGPRVDIQLVARWHQAAESKETSTQEHKD